MRIIKYLLWLFFPSRCACCNRLIKRNMQLCSECFDKLERIGKICTVCGCEKTSCECKRRVFHFAGAVAPFSHGEYSKEVVYNFKFRNNIEIANFLCSNMANSVNEHFGNIKFQCITNVPMHPLKRFIKGYDHSRVLAKRLSRALDIPYINCLHKIKLNTAQHKTPYKQRFGNVKNILRCDKISAQNVLLVDDIKTTGATLDESARQLLFAGAEKVYCVTAISNNYKKSTVEK